jgi:hypothetical protein
MPCLQLVVPTVSNHLYLLRFFTAWAHLILYGEEATRKAQKEGEDAAAAYEQEKQDIADGKILPPPPKVEKKKPKATKKGKAKKGDKNATESKKEAAAGAPKADTGASKKRKQSADSDEPRKKAKPGRKPVLSTADKEALAPILAKGASRVSDQNFFVLVWC